MQRPGELTLSLSHSSNAAQLMCNALIRGCTSLPLPQGFIISAVMRCLPDLFSRTHVQVYFPELLAPLLRSLIHVTSPPLAPPHGSDRLPEVIISYKIRSLAKETAFWSAFGLWFSFEPVLIRSRRPTEDGPQVGDGDNRPLDVWTRFGASGDGDMFVFVARRRPESLAWEIPSGDKELLEGVGAQGSSTRKGDDTFERLLLMQLEP